MRLAKIFGSLGVVACLAAVAPVTAEANSTSPYTRMNKVRSHSMDQPGMMRSGMMMKRHHMTRHHRRMMMR